MKEIQINLDDVNKLTVGEMAEIEDLTDMKFDDFLKKLADGRISQLRIMMLILGRRHDATLSLADVDAIPVADLQDVLGSIPAPKELPATAKRKKSA